MHYDFGGSIVSDVGLLVGVGVVAGVEHGEVDGAALLRVHPLVGGHGRCRGRGVLQRLPAGPGGQAATVLAVDEPVLNIKIIGINLLYAAVPTEFSLLIGH